MENDFLRTREDVSELVKDLLDDVSGMVPEDVGLFAVACKGYASEGSKRSFMSGALLEYPEGMEDVPGSATLSRALADVMEKDKRFADVVLSAALDYMEKYLRRRTVSDNNLN